MANKSVKRTSQNSKLPPLKYEVIDSYTNGDNKYELRELNTGRAIYLYSNRTKELDSISERPKPRKNGKRWQNESKQQNY